MVTRCPVTITILTYGHRMSGDHNYMVTRCLMTITILTHGHLILVTISILTYRHQMSGDHNYFKFGSPDVR